MLTATRRFELTRHYCIGVPTRLRGNQESEVHKLTVNLKGFLTSEVFWGEGRGCAKVRAIEE